jgi:hypothetical protein
MLWFHEAWDLALLGRSGDRCEARCCRSGALQLDGRCQLARMEAQILAHFKLHAVDLREKP